MGRKKEPEEWEIRLELEGIYDRVRADPYWDHLRLPGINLVPGIGPVRPRVLVCGEAPGVTENNRLRPFCGASGQALTELMSLAGLRTEDEPPDDDAQGPSMSVGALANAFITNVVKYRPPGNRTPTKGEIEHGRTALRQEWATLGRPSVLIACGSTARTALMPPHASPTPQAGTFIELSGVVLWAMYHPAFPLRQRSLRPTVEGHWEKLGEWLKGNGHVE